MSLRARILLLIGFATLAPAVVLGLLLFEERDRDIEDAKHSLGALAKFAADNLDDKVKGTVQLLHGLSRAPDLDTSDRFACSAFLAGVLARYPQYTGLLTIMPNGDLYCDSLRTNRKLNVSARSYFIQSRASSEPAFDVVIGGLTGIGVLQVAYPVRDGQGALKYVLLASLNLSDYARDFVAASQYSTFEMLIWDRKGTVIAHKPDAGDGKVAGREFARSELFRFVESPAPGAAAELPGLDGVPKVWARGVVPEPRGGGVRITLGLPREVLVANADRVFRDAMTVLIAISLLVLVAVSYVAESSIRRPVRLISSVAGRVGAGELSARIGAPYPRGELGDLMAVVDRTAGAVQAQRAEIEARSLDLQRANRALRMLSGINTLIVRARDRDELFKEACRVAVEVAGFRMAWIGLVDRASGQLVPVASAGMGDELLTAVGDFYALPTDGEKGAVARAMHEKRPVVSNDFATNSPLSLRAMHLEVGNRSGAVFPLIVADVAIGLLALYASERDFFHDEELKLLTEVAADVAFAIDYIEKDKKLDYLAHYDALTGLANRELLHGQLAQHMRNAGRGGKKLALFLIDLERFRTINETLGPPAGDALLRQVAEWLTRVAGDSSLTARVGADQFAVILPEIREAGDLVRLLEQTIDVFLRHPFYLNESTYHVAVKVGIALFPDDGDNADTLFKNAGAALKQAKARGDRFLFYKHKMTDGAAGKLTLENQLRQALDKGQFVLHYQPKVNLKSGKVTGAEALIRWIDPRTGLVPPLRFIPILEETGLIHEVGRWVMHQALKDYLRWRAAGLCAVRVAVNVSPLQLRRRDFIAEIEKALANHADAGNGLELEITESVIMEDVNNSISTLRAVRAMGIPIAIDDFGTGFSSLSYLAKLPVDTLKIDRSFVLDMTAGPQGRALVSAIINLAHSLKLNVVAEGVETVEQSRLLRLLACDEMQGYSISEPVPVDVFEAKFLTKRTSGVRLLERSEMANLACHPT
ncbi:MAG: EAL domain-containing protein [Betaproteobacteria bacterium]